MSSENNDPAPGTSGGAASHTEEDLDSDVGTIFSDEEEHGKVLDEDDDDACVEAGQVTDDDSRSSGGSSDSDDGSEKCPICLQRFSDQEVGTPEMCEHQFCLRCITAWSKKVATCPIDRKFFSTILVKKHWNGEVIRIEDVKFSNPQNNVQDYDSDPTYCEVCGRCDREEILLLCDDCDLAYHMECLDPPLEAVPIDDWFCPTCIARGINDDIDEAEMAPSSSPVAESSRPPPALVRIPRTLQNERILQSIDVPSPIQDVINAVISGINANTTGTVLRTQTRKPRKPRKSTTRKRKSTTKAAGGGTTTRRKRRPRRKTRRRRRVAVDKRPNTARGRIAHHLGIKPPLPGQVYVGLPPASRSAGGSSHSSSASTSTSSITSLRYNAGITPLRMFGTQNDLSDLVESWSDEEGPGPSVAARVPALQRSLCAILKGPPEVVSMNSYPNMSSQTGNCDVLGSILKKQYILHNDKNIKISRDGTLVPSMSSSHLPDLTTTRAQKFSKSSTTTTSPSSSRGDGGSNSNNVNRVQAKITECGLNNAQTQGQNTNQSNNSENGSGNNTTSSESVANNSRRLGTATQSSSSSPCGSTNDNDNPTEFWGTENSSQRPDDDDFDIYSDIEEQEAEKTDPSFETTAPASSNISTDGNKDDDGNKTESMSAGRNPSLDSSNETQQDDHDSDLDEMVIDEDTESGAKHQQSPRKDGETSESTSSRRNSNDSIKKNSCKNEHGEKVEPKEDEVTEKNLPESPESIPLPNSPPPEVSDTEERTEKIEENTNIKDERKKVSSRKPREYDPSEPLTSSDEDEKTNKKSAASFAKGKKIPSKEAKGTLFTAQSRTVPTRKKTVPLRKKVEKKPESSTAAHVDLSSIPIPPEEVRRPVIHFSIPKRHNLIPISSLMKRQKGLARKETKGDGSTINFQSEISKAFGSEAQNDINTNDDGDETYPKISLVAEIFGSDEDDEDEVQGSAETTVTCNVSDISSMPTEGKIEEQTETENSAKPANTESAIDVSSGRWKTVSQVVKDPNPTANLPSEENKSNNSNLNGGNTQEKNISTVPVAGSEEEPEIIEIVTLNCPARPPSRRFVGPHDVETISDSSNSDIEVITEVNTPNTKGKEKDRGSRSRSPSPRNRRDNKRRHSASSESNFEDGEIMDPNADRDGVHVKRRRKDKKRKEKVRKRRNSKDREAGTKKHQSGGPHSNISSADEEAGDDITWKKPAKVSNDKNYRRGKSKPSHLVSDEKASNRSVSPRLKGRRGRGSASPSRNTTSPSLKRLRYSNKSPLRSRANWSRHRMRSRSGSSANSCNSFRSSSRHHPLHRSSVSPPVGHSRSPSRSPVPIRLATSRVSSNRRSRSASGDGNREKSGRQRKTVTRHTRSRSKSNSPMSRSKKRNKYSSKSAAIANLKRKKTKLTKKTGKATLVKAKRKEKEQRSKERSEKRKISKAKFGGVEEEKLSPSKNKSERGKERGEKKKRKREKSLSPVKAIVADGDSIVVSLSFQKDTSNHGTLTSEKSSGKVGGKKYRESKQQRSSSKLKENSVKARSPSVNKSLLDLGAEDLSSNSESSSATSNKINREKEIGASKVSSSADGSTTENYKSIGGSGVDENSEIQGDSLVTSTRDSLEPSTITEDDYPNSGTSPANSKAASMESANKLTTQNVSSTAHSPRVQGANPNLTTTSNTQVGTVPQPVGINSIGVAQKSSSTSSSAGLDLLSSQTGAAAAAAAAMSASFSQSSQQLRYPPASSNMLNPVLATVASALMAVRQQTSGSHPSLVGGSGMQGMMKPAKGKGRSNTGNYQGGGDGSPMSPNSSDGDDLFEPPTEQGKKGSSSGHQSKDGSGNISNLFDTLFGSEPSSKQTRDGKLSKSKIQNRPPPRKVQKKESSGQSNAHSATCDININEDVPASAVELSVQEKLINKINRQERVVEEVKMCLKPHYIKKHVSKEEYKEILRRAVPKICHSKTGEINPFKIRELIDAYVRKFRHNRKKSA